MNLEKKTIKVLTEEVKNLYKENHSLQKTAEQLDIAYGKVRKILITLDEYHTTFSDIVSELRETGFSTAEIALKMGTTEKRVNAFLPYERGIYDEKNPTEDAKKSKKYRERIEVAKSRIVSKNKSKEHKIIVLEGEKNMQKRKAEIYPIRLHLKLQNDWCDNEEKRILMKYVDSTENGTLERDILIPSDMPLHNLHYTIQKLYGWQNSHLRCFYLDEKDYDRITGTMVKGWADLVGVLFQGLVEDEEDEFWDDHFDRGSFKTWLKKKYTGPYTYGGYIETYLVAKRSMKEFIDSIPQLEVREPFHKYYERTKKVPENKKEGIKIVKIVPILEATLQELNDSIIIEKGTNKLLERLEVNSVLTSPQRPLAEAKKLGTRLINPIYETNGGINEKMEEPEVLPVTHKLLYNYDYGDNWVVEITMYDDCYDLLEKGLITAEELRNAQQIVEDKHKPVCIYNKGAQVLDDVGGMSGYANFISTIYESNDAKEKAEYRSWAESLGWSSRKVSMDKLL